MKTFFQRLQPRVVNYTDYKCFGNVRFRANVSSLLGKENTDPNENALRNFLM